MLANTGGSQIGASGLSAGVHAKASRTMTQINQIGTCAYRDFVADFIWNRSGKCDFCNPYFATKGAIPRVWFSIRLLTCEI
jgi:hypothetical protein